MSFSTFTPFVHLHNHSDFSLLSGMSNVKEIIHKAVEQGQPAVGLTDYGNLFGAIEFYSQALDAGVKPIMGCELFVCDNHKKKVSEGPRGPRYAQIVLLARNNEGWKNLLKLVSIGYLEGFYYKPRIDRALLRKYGAGLIALSSGKQGEIERLLQQGDDDGARVIALEYKEIFNQESGESDCFFIELQDHGSSEQRALNEKLMALAYALDIPLLASNNSHFIQRDDFEAFEAMLALRDNRTLDDVEHSFSQECYMKSYDEMAHLFADVPEAISNSLHIAKRCNVDLQFGQYKLPDFQTPDAMNLADYMCQQATNGLDARWPTILAGKPDADREKYEARLKFELDIINQMGFPGYFLIVADFIQWSKDQEIPVGPGRGSGAGSLVAYSMLITDLDPIKYGLLFERFLNPERVSMPDFDIDFCMSRREEAIRYVTQKYGEEKVSQIITFGAMKAKAVVRDVGRVLAMDLAKVNLIAKLIPDALKMTLDKAVQMEERLAKLIDEDDEVARLFDLARKLEGKHRNAGTHAAGVVIGREALVENAPLFKVTGAESKVVQWDMGNSEKMGLIKFDFLGLKTLTVIHLACRLVRQQKGDESFDITAIPMHDEVTFQLMQRGQTKAVFQVESQGMRELLTELKPDCFEDIIALVALYRPGPMESGMVGTYVECKHGRQEIVYPLPQLKPILQETNGVILYQEQVMQIAQVLGGYSLGQADMLRRAMGKKKPEEMAIQRKIFMEGSEKQGVPADKAEHVFDLMEKFAGYGFNKSHSAAYALICYQTAYLKAHFPQAFMAATLSCDMGNTDKIAVLVADCVEMGLTMLPPDVNASDWEFIPEGEAIRFGMGAIKGVGEAAIRCLVETRKKDDIFTSFDEMVMRLPAKTLNKRLCEALIKAGAMNAMIPHMHSGLTGVAAALDEASRRRHDRLANQVGLFGVAEVSADGKDLFPWLEPWDERECLQSEREVLGFYLSGHPLQSYLHQVSGLADMHLGQLSTCLDEARVVIPIFVSAIREYRASRGTMAFVQLEDLHGRAEMVIFAQLYGLCRDILQEDVPLLLAAKVDASKDEPTLIAEALIPLDKVLPELAQRITVTIAGNDIHAESIQTLKTLSQSLKEPCNHNVQWQFQVGLANGSIARLESGLPAPLWTNTARRTLHECFGADAISIQCATWKPERVENRTFRKKSA
ncbi:MAG: DNA polymerase III subunit alpha [Mariprofundaceae bacterium]|nr:DNA polymerase III subunit alpha [Mariprofundaceae bacterium]